MGEKKCWKTKWRFDHERYRGSSSVRIRKNSSGNINYVPVPTLSKPECLKCSFITGKIWLNTQTLTKFPSAESLMPGFWQQTCLELWLGTQLVFLRFFRWGKSHPLHQPHSLADSTLQVTQASLFIHAQERELSGSQPASIPQGIRAHPLPGVCPHNSKGPQAPLEQQGGRRALCFLPSLCSTSPYPFIPFTQGPAQQRCWWICSSPALVLTHSDLEQKLLLQAPPQPPIPLADLCPTYLWCHPAKLTLLLETSGEYRKPSMGTLATWQLSVKGMMASLLKSLNSEDRKKKKPNRNQYSWALFLVAKGKFA